MRSASFGTNARPAISTGSLAVDRALGVGGVPRSRVTEILSPEGGGKTTLAQHIVAEAQKLGGTAVYIDMEHAVDLAYMAACGVDTSAVYFSQPDSGTDALNIVRKLVSSNTVDLIVVDSVQDASGQEGHPGLQGERISESANQRISESASRRVGESASQRWIASGRQPGSTSSGARGSIEGESIGHGRENTKKYLGEHPELMDTIRAAVLGLEEDDGSDENS
jgi:protein RecA